MNILKKMLEERKALKGVNEAKETLENAEALNKAIEEIDAYRNKVKKYCPEIEAAAANTEKELMCELGEEYEDYHVILPRMKEQMQEELKRIGGKEGATEALNKAIENANEVFSKTRGKELFPETGEE